MESQVSLHLEETKAPSPSSTVSKTLLTTVPLVLKTLPYFGWADECKVLMTQLRSQSRSLWFSQEDRLLAPVTDKYGIQRFHLQKRELCITNLGETSRPTGEPLEVSELNRLVITNDYKLYLLDFDFMHGKEVEGLGVLRDFIKSIDLIALSISKISSYFKRLDEYYDEEDTYRVEHQEKQLDLLSKVAELLDKEVKKTQEHGRTLLSFPKPFEIICDEFEQPIYGAKDSVICDYNSDARLSIEEKCLKQLQSYGLSTESLCDYYSQALELMTPQTLFHKLEHCGLTIDLSELYNRDEAMGFDAFETCFTQLFERMKIHEDCVEEEDLKLPKVKLKYWFKKREIGYKEALKALEFISSCFHYLKNKCAAISLKIDKGSCSNYEYVTGESCYLGVQDEHGTRMIIFKLANFNCKLSQGFTIDQGFIIFKEFYLECEGIEEASPADLEEAKLLTEDLSVFIPLEEVKTLSFDFYKDSELFKGPFQNLSELRLEISPSALEDSDTYEKLQVFQNNTKVWVEVVGRYTKNDVQEESKVALFKALERFNLQRLDMRRLEINNQATLASLNSFLEKTNPTSISVEIRASQIENEEFES
ncbi:unnamed protein product [Moneuplotes crassus]|uniref:Uncharacterized protein n=1 Tax=Euplotes crassus TaxID=5936 RepID=A0AAD1XCL3_EUPCR|nr:unnamed protein product [Moneuplotes crassus]